MEHKSVHENRYLHIADNLQLFPLTEDERKKLLQDGMSVFGLSPLVYFVEFSCLNRGFHGIGIKNVNGGIEFLDDNMTSPVTLNNTGYVAIYAAKGKISKECCLFFNFVDYLAFLALQKADFLKLAKECDCFIMSHVKNFIPMVVESDGYGKIYTFFPNNTLGVTISKTIEARNKRHVQNCDVLYGHHEYFHSYVNEISKKLKL